MPKARKRNKAPSKRATTGERGVPPAPAPAPRQSANRAFFSTPVRGPQSLITPGIVALGCWGLTISFVFFTNEANHLLYGGVAAAMALTWTFSFGLRARKLYLLRQRA